MRRLVLMAVLAVVCGCQTPPAEEPAVVHLRPRPRGGTVESFVVCTFDVVVLPRSDWHKLEHLFSTTETAGVWGPDRKLMTLNGLRIARSDTRFRAQFAQALAAMKTGPRRATTYVRLPEGKQQDFDVGGVLQDETLFAWDRPDSVTGWHFREVRYRMSLSMEGVRKDVAELGLAWQAIRRPALRKPVSLPSLDTHVELEVGQSAVVAPAGFSGRGVGRAFLSGVEEKAVEVTFFVITPTEIREKTPPPAGPG